MLGIRAADPAPAKQVGFVVAVVHAVGVVEHLANLNPTMEKIVASALDIGDDQI